MTTLGLEAVKPIRRRKRPSLACENCRKRKIKCDREIPCSQCAKSGFDTGCNYELGAPSSKSSRPYETQPIYIKSAKTPLQINTKKRKVSDRTPPTIHDVPRPNNGYQPVPAKFVQFEHSQPSTHTMKKEDQPSRSENPEMVMISKSTLDALNNRLSHIESAINSNQTHGIRSSSVSPTNSSAGNHSIKSDFTNPTEFSEVSNDLNTKRYIPNSAIKTPIFLHPNKGSPSLPNSTLSPFSGSFNLHQPLPNPSTPNSSGTNSWASSDVKSHFQRKPSVSTSDSSFLPYLKSGSYSSFAYGTPSTSSSFNDYRSSLEPTDKVKLPPINPHAASLSACVKSTELSDVIGIIPYLNEDDSINLYENYSSVYGETWDRRANYGPFSWASLMRKDICLRVLWDHMRGIKDSMGKNVGFHDSSAEVSTEDTKIISQNYSSDKAGNMPELDFKKKDLEKNGYEDVVPYEKIKLATKERRAAQMNLSTLPLGLTFFEGKINNEIYLVDKIRLVMPKKRVVWTLLDRFFAWLYPFMPFLDQECFNKTLAKLIGPRSDDDVNIEELKVVSRKDLAYLGTLLVVLRMLYLSLFVNKASVNEQRLVSEDPSPEAQELKYLLSNPISIDLIDLAQMCQNQFQVMRRNLLAVLQLCLFLRIYQSFAPEEGDAVDGSDAQISNATMVQMAFSMGLNRDPEKIEGMTCPRENHLCRKIWWFLYNSSIFHSYSYGDPLFFLKSSADVKEPFFSPEGCNVEDKDLDMHATQLYERCSSFIKPIAKLLTVLLDVNGRAKLSYVSKLLTTIEVDQYQKNGLLKDCLKQQLSSSKHSAVFRRNYQIKVYFSLNLFLISLYFHFFLHYLDTDIALSFFYVKKMLLINIQNFMPHYFELLDGGENMLDFIMNPLMEQMVHKSNIVLLGLNTRVNNMMFSMMEDPNHIIRMENDSTYRLQFISLAKNSFLLKRCTEISIAAISKISNRYYYAWKIMKSHTYMLQTIQDPEFYRKNRETFKNQSTTSYPNDYLQTLIEILEKPVTKFSHIEQLAPQFCSTCPEAYMESELQPLTQDLSYLHSKEVDLIWYQMLTMKYDKTKSQQNLPLKQGNAPDEAEFPNDVKFGFSLDEISRFDLFNELPFDSVFK